MNVPPAHAPAVPRGLGMTGFGSEPAEEIHMTAPRTVRRLATAAALAVAAVGAAQAHTLAAVTAVGNYIFNAGVPVLPGMTTPLFANGAGQRFIVTFSAECAVNAPAGSHIAYTDVDIVVLNAAGAVVQTLPPTAGNLGAFCAANGTVGVDGWHANSVTAIGGAGLPVGNYRVQVRARLNNGATQASYGERSLVVTR